MRLLHHDHLHMEEAKMRYVTTIEPVLIEGEWELRVLTKSHGNLLVDERKLLVDDPMIMYKQEQKMPYVTSIERMGIEKGLQQGLRLGILKSAREAILKVLKVRFPNISPPASLVQTIQGIDKKDVLETLHEESILVESIPTFEQKVTEIASKNGSE